jgi:class 3 adenylate cyclase
MIGRMSPQVRPSGTVSFLFTDIEGSTSLWERDADAMCKGLARHDEIVRGSVAHGGYVFATGGDGFRGGVRVAAGGGRSGTRRTGGPGR